MTGVKNHDKKYLIKTILLAVFLFLLKDASAHIIINEIMYNPSGTDAGHEWLEIYNNGTSAINIGGWKLYESNANHALTLVNGSYVLRAGEYAVISHNSEIFLEDYPTFNGALIESHWSYLSNSGEYVALKNASSGIADWVSYSAELANGNGRSLERFDYGWNESSTIGGTPGKQNKAQPEAQSQGLKLSVYLDSIAYVGFTYTSLFKIENLDHVAGITDHINLTLGYNITSNSRLVKEGIVFIENLNSYSTSNTGSFTPLAAGNYTITGWIVNSTIDDKNAADNLDSKTIMVIDSSATECNISLNITTDKEIYAEGETLKFRHTLNNETFPFTIEYWIEDFFGNVYKNKYNTTNTNQKSWKTAIAEQDRVLYIKSLLYTACNNFNSGAVAEKMFIVVSGPNASKQSEESSLEILEAPEIAKFGDTANVKIKAYKGKTRAYSISLWIEGNGKRASEITKIHLYEKHSSYNGQLPIKIYQNCGRELQDGRYYVVASGLGKQDKKEIMLEGTHECQKQTTKTSSSGTRTKFSYALVNYPEKVSPGEKFNITIRLTNNNSHSLKVNVWSYVYRGPKSYSGKRDANKKSIILNGNSSVLVNLTNKIGDAAGGEYNLKVIISKEGRKTNYEIVKMISIEPKLGASAMLPKNTAFANTKENELTANAIYRLKLPPRIAYESAEEKIKNLAALFIIIVSVFLNIILIFKR
jgi:hypothetical protein